MRITGTENPIAIAMWDFSWLERRWTGGGYEDWDVVLEQLKDRCYDAVRIDAYPYLVSSDPNREWELTPNPMPENEWGSPGRCRVKMIPYLTDFIRKCSEFNIDVGLSTWFREDSENTRMDIESPDDLGEIWIDTVQKIEDEELLDSILYVDLCNEFPHENWAPFVDFGDEERAKSAETTSRWIGESIDAVREVFPNLDYCFSFTHPYGDWSDTDVSAMDLLELHIWMDQSSDFNEKVGKPMTAGREYYESLAENGREIYSQSSDHWKDQLKESLDLAVRWSKRDQKPIVTTEGWAVVFYRDWPGLDWDWVKELCEFGVKEAIDSGRWIAACSSNFCGPQFRGMWEDVEWHREITNYIHGGSPEV